MQLNANINKVRERDVRFHFVNISVLKKQQTTQSTSGEKNEQKLRHLSHAKIRDKLIHFYAQKISHTFKCAIVIILRQTFFSFRPFFDKQKGIVQTWTIVHPDIQVFSDAEVRERITFNYNAHNLIPKKRKFRH